MSNFPFAWWDSTITIYNKFIDPTTQRVSWYRTVVENCFWKNVNGVYYKGKLEVEVKQIICRIPQNENYVNKREWKELQNKSERFTLANGDIIVLGEVDDTIDEYTAGMHSTDLLTKYKEFDECLQIDNYTDNVRQGVGMPHYKVIGL